MFGLKPKKIELEKNADDSIKLLTKEQMDEQIFYAEKKEEARLQLMAILSNNTITIEQPFDNIYRVLLDGELLFSLDTYRNSYTYFDWVVPNRELNAPLRFHNILDNITQTLRKDDIQEILEMKLNATLTIDKHSNM